jgi:hypothetical protein
MPESIDDESLDKDNNYDMCCSLINHCVNCFIKTLDSVKELRNVFNFFISRTM